VVRAARRDARDGDGDVIAGRRRALALGLAAVAAGAAPPARAIAPDALRRALRAGEFPGPVAAEERLEGKVVTTGLALRRLGIVTAGAARFELWGWIWRWRSFGGRAERQTTRLIVVANDALLGWYDVDELPSAFAGADAVFAVPHALGDRIRFAATGPPAAVRLDGQSRSFVAARR
jgi:hypothetical protein